jgi:pectate lyase
MLIAFNGLFAAVSPDFPIAGWAVSGNTTGGAGYGEVTVDNTSDLKSYAKAGNKVIYVKPGTYAGQIDVGSNVTLYGYPGAIITQPHGQSAIKVSGVSNVIIRNFIVKGIGAVDIDANDCVQINSGASKIWIDHLDIYDGQDGNLDIVNASDYVTISWTKFSYTSASSDHQFSNLIGNSDSKTTDSGHLRVTLHHNWWADGVKERMPRVRFGRVHVANNLFETKTSSSCVRAGYKADLRVENNVFIGVKKPIDLYEGDYTAVSVSGNYFEGTTGNTSGNKTAFTPSYSMPLTDVSNKAKAYALRDSIRNFAGATLPAPGTVYSSSSVTSSSSSSVDVSAPAVLEKHGSGSSNQTVVAGESIASFYYTWVNASGVTVEGLPAGVSYVLDEEKKNVYFEGTVESSTPAGDYTFTVTTVGNPITNAVKSGTIKVTSTTSIESSYFKSSGFQITPKIIQSEASITFNLKKQGLVSLSIIDLSGREVFSKKWNASTGMNQMIVNSSSFTAGVYYVQLKTPASESIQKIVIR